MNIYKDGFKPYKVPEQPQTAPSKVRDVQLPSSGEAPSRVRQSIINSVIKSRGNHKSVFQPLLTHNILQRQYLGGVNRTNNLPDNTFLEGPDYDFREIDKVLAMDGFAARAMRTLISSSLKGHRGNNGFKFVSRSESAKQYVKNRFDELTFSVDGTGSIESFMRQLTISFVNKSNVIVWLQRKSRGKSKKQYMWQGRMHNEIQAIEVVDPTIVDVARSSDTQDVKGFRIRTGGTDQVVTFSDCYLLRWEDMRQDNLFAQPIITPVLDDILVLRRIEEIHELALGKATFPMTHVAIGDPKRDPKVFGKAGIDTEISRTKAALESQAPEGFLVTPYYYKVSIIQPNNTADFLPYMEYYRDRIITGLNMDGPSMGLGNTSNRNTAVSMSEQLMEKVRDIRSAIAEELNRTVIREILWEGGYDPSGENAVFLVWEDPDHTISQGWENHYTGLYVAGTLTLTEARAQMGYPPLKSAEESDLYVWRSQEAKASFNPTKTQPQNQHGKSASKPARSKRKDHAEQMISSILMRAQEACHEDPSATSGLLRIHFGIIDGQLSRYIKDEAFTKNLKRIEEKLVNKIRNARNSQEIAEAFDLTKVSMSAWLDELEKIEEVIEDADSTGLHESKPAEHVPESE